ncbi:hypothetical protein [Streptomyces sp. URMC 129]
MSRYFLIAINLDPAVLGDPRSDIPGDSVSTALRESSRGTTR